VVFIIFVLIVFMTQKQTQINWVEDYQAGIDMAKKQNKPVLLAFYRMGTRYTSDMWENTYINPQVKQFVEANFIYQPAGQTIRRGQFYPDSHRCHQTAGCRKTLQHRLLSYSLCQSPTNRSTRRPTPGLRPAHRIYPQPEKITEKTEPACKIKVK
jgi:hypothetical protein